MTITPNYMPLVRINAPEFYKDQDFIRWLNAPGTATWHIGGNPGEYSDAFFTFDQGEGSDAYTNEAVGIPEHIWKQICEAIEKELGTWLTGCLVWLTNLEE